MRNPFPMGASIMDGGSLGFGLGFWASGTGVVAAENVVRLQVDPTAKDRGTVSPEAIKAAAAQIAANQPATTFLPAGAGGMPSWVLPVAIGAGALVLFMVLRKS